MSFTPAFAIGLGNAWLFMVVYPLQWLLAVTAFKHISDRTGHPDDLQQGRKAKNLGQLTQLLWVIASLYSIFLPLRMETAWFYAGLAVFVIGLIILVIASLNVTRTPADKPFTGGVYRFSRHPMYLSMIFVYTGVSIAAVSWLFLAITIATFFLMRYQMLQEEDYCCEKFGDTYREYMKITPRWIGLPKTG